VSLQAYFAVTDGSLKMGWACNGTGHKLMHLGTHCVGGGTDEDAWSNVDGGDNDASTFG